MKKLLFFLVTIAINAQSNSFKGTNQLNPKAEDNVVVVYPNPVRDVLMLKAKNSSVKIKSVVIYSIVGVQIDQYQLNSNSAELHLERLASGRYLLRYTLSNNTQKTTQIIKQ